MPDQRYNPKNPLLPSLPLHFQVLILVLFLTEKSRYDASAMIAGPPIRWYDPGTWPWIVWIWLLLMLAGWIKPAWRWFRNQLARNWPEAQGKIDSAVFEARDGSSRSGKDPSYRAKLFYSYGAGGQVYQGKWQKDFDAEYEAEEFVRDLEGKPVTVVYSPRRPSWSTLLQDAVIALTNTRPPRPDVESGPGTLPELPLWLKPIVRALMAIAAVGLGLSLWVHFAALGGHKVAPDALFAGLHLGIFVVFIPAAMIAGRRTGNYRRLALKAIMKGLPVWMKLAVCLFSGYATISFVFFFYQASAQTSTSGGPPPMVCQGFSGHWMAGYSWALAVLYSMVHAPNESNVVRPHPKV